jgi:hypothetical protein
MMWQSPSPLPVPRSSHLLHRIRDLALLQDDGAPLCPAAPSVQAVLVEGGADGLVVSGVQTRGQKYGGVVRVFHWDS